ncbi:MAG TPA: alpha/beta hydrolase [Candidatus Saccharimonadales bacterium]|jgi:pimeloyl-ACP methyl ester carboxylesterase
MNTLLTTPNFRLAAYIKGDPNSARLAIVLPGRLDTKGYVHMHSLVDLLSDAGYLALSFDYPGTWESPGDISLYTTTNNLKAINEVIAHFGGRPTLLVGHSNGGKLATLASTTNPAVTHFIAIMSGTDGHTKVDAPKPGEDVVVSLRDLPPGTTRTEAKKEFLLPRTYFDDMAHYSATRDLKSCTKPKLFFYGTQDVLVSPESVKSAYGLSAGPKELHELNSEHDYRLHPDIIEEVSRTILEFLDKH